MAKANKITDEEQVSAHIAKLDITIAKTIEKIRRAILDTDPLIGERIKWNNPSFYYTGEMKAFDPKEYKREIIVMNLFRERIMLVWPSGVKLNNDNGLLEGDYKDGRRLMVFKDLKDFESKEGHLRSLLKEWISLVDQ